MRVDFDMEMHVLVDEVGAEEAEEFAGDVVAAVGGAIELQNTLAGAFEGESARSCSAVWSQPLRRSPLADYSFVTVSSMQRMVLAKVVKVASSAGFVLASVVRVPTFSRAAAPSASD
jgi:hypothetical protein